MTGHRQRYRDLGVRPIINANATLTALGGSLMPPVVLDAMRDAAGAFVDMFELQDAVSRRLAELTQNESAFVCNGASNGIVLSVLAAITGPDLRVLATLMREGADARPRNEVVLHRAHRIPYDPVIQLTGARVVEVGNVLQTFPWELESALTDRTAAVLFVAGAHLEAGALPLEEVVEIAHAAGVPVIVDAAAQLPPPDNLWSFTHRGADLALFSGGKALRGPQASGLIVGSRRMTEAVAMHAAPHQRLGRSSKVGKEEMLGLLAAVEWYLGLDHEREYRRIEELTRIWVEKLDGLGGVRARRDFPSEAGRPLPRALVEWDDRTRSSRDVCRALREGEPAVDVAAAGARGIYLNAELVDDEEHEIVTDRVRATLTSRG